MNVVNADLTSFSVPDLSPTVIGRGEIFQNGEAG